MFPFCILYDHDPQFTTFSLLLMEKNVDVINTVPVAFHGRKKITWFWKNTEDK